MIRVCSEDGRRMVKNARRKLFLASLLISILIYIGQRRLLGQETR
jgi:hypothetical protein